MKEDFNTMECGKKKNAFISTALLVGIFLIIIIIILVIILLTRGKGNNNSSKKTSQEDCVNNPNSAICETLRIKEHTFNDNIQSMKETAMNYFSIDKMPKKVGETKKMSLKDMQDKHLILDMVDSNGDKCSSDNSYVEVTKREEDYAMKIYLSCDDMEDYIMVYLGCYDYCQDKICEKQPEPEELAYLYEYQKVTSCKLGNWGSWGKWQLKRESTSKYKKEDIKVVVNSKDIVDTKPADVNPTTYNCDKYPEYTLDGEYCVRQEKRKDVVPATPSSYGYSCEKYAGYKLNGKVCEKTIITEKKYEATPNPTTYNCDKYPGYTLDGTKCKKVSSTTDTIDATVSYTCPSGYTLSGTKCNKKTTDTKDATKKYSCPSGYTLSGTKCSKSTTTSVNATPKYSTRSVPYTCTKEEAYGCTRTVSATCYQQQCTTKTVFKCVNGSCGNYPETSCENVPYTCTREESATCYRTVSATCYKNEQYISGYTCPSGYTLSGTKCNKTTTDTKDATVSYTCPSGYTLSGTKCNKTTTSTVDATKKYSCPSGYTLSGTKCNKTTTSSVDATKKYSCPSGYTLSGTKCSKISSVTDVKDATKNPTTYNCDKYSGAILQGDKCIVKTSSVDKKDAERVVTGYTCPDKYKLHGTDCSVTIITIYKRKAPVNPTTYNCSKYSGYVLNGDKCIKTTKQDATVTYYRYATRSCTGGSKDTQWSYKNDPTLLSKGYTMTGKKKVAVSK